MAHSTTSSHLPKLVRAEEGNLNEQHSNTLVATPLVANSKTLVATLVAASELLLEKADERVRYRAASEGEDACGTCRFYDAADLECSLVEGSIDSARTCNLWTKQMSVASSTLPTAVSPPEPSDTEEYDSEHGYGWSETEANELFQVFVAHTFAADDFSGPQWIPFLPTPGKYQHPTYGEINITPSFNAQLVASVKDHVYQENIPLDVEHETKLSGAVAWLKDMRLNDDGSADAYVEWTDRGKQLLKGGQFKYVSPEWFGSWRDPASGIVHRNVVAGGAITTRPFFKDKVLRALVASEQGAEMLVAPATATSPTEKESFTDMAKQTKCSECGASFAEPTSTCPKCGAKFAEETTPVVTITNTPPTPTASTETGPTPPTQSIVSRNYTPATYSAAEVDEKIKAATATFAEQQTAMTTELEAAKTLAASEKAARETLATQLSEIQKATRHAKFIDLVAGRGGGGDGARWAGDSEKHVAFLEKITEQFGEDNEIVTTYIEQQAAIAQQLAESNAFREIGSSGGHVASDPEKKLEEMAKARQSAEPKLTFSEAYEAVLRTTEGARLYEQMV